MGKAQATWSFKLCAFILLTGINFPCNGNVIHMSVDEAEPQPTNKETSRPFSFAKHFNDHMVLQKAPVKAVIYGFSPDIGQKVIGTLMTAAGGHNYTTVVTKSPDGDGGVWHIELDPMEVNVTAKIFVTSAAGQLALYDVIFGDVWICSGQSNMEFVVSQMFGGKEEIADAVNFPNIRVMTVSERESSTPVLDFISIDEPWARASSKSIGGKAWSHFSAVCWLFGKAMHKATGIPMGLLDTNWGGTPVEAWSSPEALKSCGMEGQGQQPSREDLVSGPTGNHESGFSEAPQGNSVLWNAMIYPLLPMPIYGAIWYQGEQDSHTAYHTNHYNCTFPAMIRDWRLKFNISSHGAESSTFPFGFVQLAPNRSDVSQSFVPDIRWHQTADYGYVPNPKMPNVFMAVAMDLPDFNSTYGSVHPRDKKDVGYRLSLGGLTLAYNQPQLYQGPLPIGGALAPNRSAFILDYGETWQLDVRVATGFEFCCSGDHPSEKSWLSAPIVGWTNTTVAIKIPDCGTNWGLTQLSYAWRESPCAFKLCAVYSKVNSLPAPPFVAKIEAGTQGRFTMAEFAQSKSTH